MAQVLPDTIDDLSVALQPKFIRGMWVDLSLGFQKYVYAQRAFPKGKERFKSGSQLDWKVQVANTGTARVSGMYDTDVTSVRNLLKTAQQPWSKITVNYSYDIDEAEFQGDPETIVDTLQVREHSMYSDYFALQEEKLWSAPTSSTQDPRPPSGIPFWIQKDATTTVAGGFNGGNPSGFSSGAAGLSSTTYPNYSNWTFGYTNVTRDDLVEKMLKSTEFTHFDAPHSFKELAGAMPDTEIYTTYSVYSGLTKLLESRNDNLGVDLSIYQGRCTLKGSPITWVPYLNTNDSSNPVYGVNWSCLKYYCQKNREMKRYKPKIASNSHTVREVHMDSWGNWAGLNRRGLWVGSTS
jgi:hypothetical protein